MNWENIQKITTVAIFRFKISFFARKIATAWEYTKTNVKIKFSEKNGYLVKFFQSETCPQKFLREKAYDVIMSCLLSNLNVYSPVYFGCFKIYYFFYLKVKQIVFLSE